jgi:putative ABC transport system permease protein
MNNLRLALRTLRATPIATLVALATLALGIGANTAIFSFIDGLLLAPLAYPHAERLVSLWERAPSGRRNAMTTLNYLDYAKSPVFETVAATTVCCGPSVLSEGSQPISIPTFRVSASYFEIFGTRAALGRTFVAGEDQVGRDHVAVLSHPLWLSQFGGDPAVVGRSIRLNGEPYTIVGVTPASGPFGRVRQVWLPLSFPPDRMIRANHWLLSMTGGGVGLLKPRVTLEQARSELASIAARIAIEHPDTNRDWGVALEPYSAVLVADDLKRFLAMMLAAVGFVLLIGCVNLANLMLVRGLAREREVAIRAALGATRGQLIRQFLTESALLSVGGGVLGVAFGYTMMTALETLLRNQPLNPSFVPYWIPAEATIGISGRVQLFTLVASVMSGIGFGIVPALRASRPTKDGTIGLYHRTHVGRSQHGLQRLLIVTELALTFVLLTGAGLLIRSLIAMREADTGFSATNVLTAQLPTWEHRFGNDDELRSYFRRVIAAIEVLPGVRDVALTDGLPLQGVPNGQFFQIVGRQVVQTGQRPICDFKVVSPGYFRAMALRVRRGRPLLEPDTFGAPYVTVINETMARMYFPGVDPVGQQLLMQEKRPGTAEEIPWTIVGVLADERLTPFDDRREHPAAYVPIDQVPTMLVGLVVRSASDPVRLVESIQRTLIGIDRDQAINNVRTVDQLEVDARAPDRLRTWLLGLFAAVAILLSAIGIYGVFAHAVVQRTREVGIRAALGAQRGQLVWLVLRDGMVLTGTGLFAGFLGALAVSRLMRTFLFGVEAIDPLAIVATAVTLAAVATLACYIPARRASAINPVTALHAE